MSFRFASSLRSRSALLSVSALLSISALRPAAAQAEAPPPAAPKTISPTISPTSSKTSSSTSSSSSLGSSFAEESPAYRAGIEGGFGAGFLVALAGVGVRGEAALSSQTYAIARLTYLHASVEENSAREVGSASFGFRYLASPAYAGLEAGAMFSLEDGDSMGMLRGSVGLKSGAIDIGLSLSGPHPIVGLTLGIDVWSSSALREPGR